MKDIYPSSNESEESKHLLPHVSDFTFKSATLSEHFSQAMGEGGQLHVRQQQRLEYTIQLPYELAIE